jgi:hypothetical protein
VATWPEVQKYVRQNYRVNREPSDDLMTLTFQTTPGRDQQVYVSYLSSVDGQEWVRFASIVGEIRGIDLVRALALGSENIGCGLKQIGELLAVVHYQLMSTVDGAEIDLGLTVTAANGDELERALVGGDTY